MSKFQIIPLGGKRKNKIKVNNKLIEYSDIGTSLGMTITKTGFNSHLSHRIAIAKAEIPRLYSLVNLSPSNKRLIYQSIIKSKLIYAIIPLHTRSTTQIQKMQTIQNKSARIITKTRMREHKTSKTINEEAKLEAINITLHNRAKSIWENLDLTNNMNLKITVNENNEKHLFKSSRKLCRNIITAEY